jgi:hypothetical protein
MTENGPKKAVLTTIEILFISISPCVIFVPRFLVLNAPSLLVLAWWSLPNPPLAIVYELACRVRLNYKLKYLTMYRSNLL